MSSLSSSSTDQAVWDSYDDNASYEEDSSTTKAAAFITACRILLQRRPKRSSLGGRQQGTEFEFDPGTYEREIDDARKWRDKELLTSATPGVPGVIHAGFRTFRD